MFFFLHKSIYFECYATMSMLADAHISSLGYLWFLRLVLANSLFFSLRYINVTLGLLPPRGYVVWRDSVGVGSSRSGLKIRVRGYFSSELYRVVAPY